MYKYITLIIGALVSLICTAQVYAVSTMSIKVEHPKSPTRLNNFTLNFVTLDLQGRAITAKCYKKSPSEGSFTQFGNDIAIVAGGNSANCAITNSILNDNGVYQFYVTAAADSDTITSETVSITYDTNGPGDPRDYNKTRNACEYTIHFKTANDSGMTVKTEVYRSENTSFSADDGSRIMSVNTGSDESHDVTNTPPDCNKTYYFAIRSFDTAGNGSGIVGDSEITITSGTTTTTQPQTTGGQQARGAIPVLDQGSVLGIDNVDEALGATGSSGAALGVTTPSGEIDDVKETDSVTSPNLRPLGIGSAILLLGVLLYAFWKKKQTPNA